MNGTVYTIPLVFHVVHLGEPVGVGSNISDGQLLQALADLNNEFRNGPNDVEIEFCLAERDPDGVFTTGINRVDGSNVPNYTNIGIQRNGNEVQVKALSNWPNTEYVNVWIVHAIDGTTSGILGYAYFPGAGDDVDGIVMDVSATGNSSQSKVIAHEAGHFFNLFHTFHGGTTTTCPLNTDCTAQGDLICDTPPHLKIFEGCNATGTNACDSGSSNSLFVHNHMSYSDNSCRDEFTHDQVMRMRCAMMSLRSDLMYSIGCEPPCSTVVASFTASATTIEQGESVSFTNTSTGATSYTWLVEGQEFSSTDLFLVFPSPGFISVCLRATDGSCTNQFCMVIEVQPMDCPTPEVIDCEYLFNGDLGLSTVPNGSSVHPLGSGDACNWVVRNSSPFFCSDFAFNTFGLNHEFARQEGVVTETELEFVDGESYLLSFEYHVVPAGKIGSDNPNLEVGLALTPSIGLSLPGDHILLNFTNLLFDDNELVPNRECHGPNAAYNSASLCFTYREEYGKHLYFINTNTGLSATVFVKNISVKGCGICEDAPPCGEGLEFELEVEDCTATLTATTNDPEGDLCWDLGNGVTAEGPIVEHEYPFGGEFVICLTQKCDPENAHTVCHEVVIPDSCNVCDTLDMVTAVLCEESGDTTISDYYLANFSFEVPKGYGPCQEDDLFVWSGDVEIFVTSFDIDDSNTAFDVIDVAIVIVPEPGSTFESTIGFITLCNGNGDVVCRMFELEASVCERCMPEVESDAACSQDTINNLFVYEGTAIVTLPPSLAGYTECGFNAPEVGFEIVNYSYNPSTYTWTIEYTITTTEPDLGETSALLCFIGPSETQYCVPLAITVSESCAPLPTECPHYWNIKDMSCTGEAGGNIVFDFPEMTVNGGEYQLCEEGLFGTVDGGTVVVTSGSVNGIWLTFDIDILIPAATFVPGQVYDLRLYLCDFEGEVVCYLFHYQLDCPEEGGGEGERGTLKAPVGHNGTFVIAPNPASDRLTVTAQNAAKGMGFQVLVYDHLGRLVEERPVAASRTVFATDSYPPGIYFVSILVDGLSAHVEKIAIVR